MSFWDELRFQFWDKIGIILLCALILFTTGLMICSVCGVFAEEDAFINVASYVWAIGKAENSETYPYGIKSIDTHGNKEYAKSICENTIKNNYRRWIKEGKPKPFLHYLAGKYCPRSVDPIGHRNWIKNVAYFLKQRGDQ